MIKVSAINLSAIKNNSLKTQLPELYELKKVIENSRTSHKNDSVFDHTLRCWEKIEEYLKGADRKINSYLEQKIDSHTRKQILFLGILFHDIGKKETIVTENGFTKCPKHAEIGAEKVKPILNRLDLSQREKEFVMDLTRYHLVPFLIVTSSNQEIDYQITSVQKEYPNIFLELILIGMADILGNQLKEGDPNEFSFRIKYYQKTLKNI